MLVRTLLKCMRNVLFHVCVRHVRWPRLHASCTSIPKYVPAGSWVRTVRTETVIKKRVYIYINTNDTRCILSYSATSSRHGQAAQHGGCHVLEYNNAGGILIALPFTSHVGKWNVRCIKFSAGESGGHGWCFKPTSSCVSGGMNHAKVEQEQG